MIKKENSKSPQKPRKTKNKTEALSTSADPLNADDLQYINEVLKNSFNRYDNVVTQQFRDYRDDIDNLQNTVREFLDDFLIIGHTPDERRIIVRYAPTPKGYDGLKELSRDCLMKMFINGRFED